MDLVTPAGAPAPTPPSITDPDFPALQREAVDLLAAIRDHLDIPLYPEGDKQARRAWRDLLEVRHADVLATLNNLLGVHLIDVTEHAAQLRAFAAEQRGGVR